jgi:hypothetical protein
MRESVYQSRIIKRLERMFPGCVILKNDPGYKQGIPDLTIFYNDRWGTLEVKTSEDAEEQPNQDYYVGRLNEMSFSAFIYPENEEQVLSDLQIALGTKRPARIS